MHAIRACRSLLRVLDFVSDVDDTFNPRHVAYSIVHYVPQAVQFATFGLLVVFWIKVGCRARCPAKDDAPTAASPAAAGHQPRDMAQQVEDAHSHRVCHHDDGHVRHHARGQHESR